MVSVGETLKFIEQGQLRQDLPVFDVGDMVKMMVKVAEGDKVRLHPFEGTVISKKGGGIHASFTVRKISFGEGVERVFPLHSPVIESLQVVSKGMTQRAKLYYLRGRVGKKARVRQEQTQ
jgi:large subunit ribosomal protein L19